MKTFTQKLKIGLILLLVATTLVGYGQNVVSVRTDKGKSVYRTKTLGNDFKIEYEGTIEVTDDDKDIKSISRGGYLEISSTSFGNRRYILIEAESGDGLYREYRDGRTKVDWEPAGREYLAEILPEVLRSTTIAAKSRVDRFYRQGGADAVISEIGRIKSDYVQSKYYQILIDKDGLTTGDLTKIAASAGDNISSDYYLAEILKKHSGKFFKSESALTAYLESAGEINSDYYLSVVLKKAIEDVKLNSKQLQKLLDTSGGISSDHYQTSVLQTALRKQSLDANMINQVIRQSKQINSDHYQGELIKTALDGNDLSGEVLNTIVEAVTEISSDHYMYTVFDKILKDNRLDQDVTYNIARKVTSSMSSDHYASLILTKLAANDLSKEGFEMVVDAASDMGSDHYASLVFKKLGQSELSDSEFVTLLKGSKSISSDHYLTQFLVGVASKASRASSAVQDAYKDAADEVNSETYYGRVMKAFNN